MNSRFLEALSQTATPVITFTSMKGGVGKSTSAAVLAKTLEENNVSAGIIDLDRQMNLNTACEKLGIRVLSIESEGLLDEMDECSVIIIDTPGTEMRAPMLMDPTADEYEKFIKPYELFAMNYFSQLLNLSSLILAPAITDAFSAEVTIQTLDYFEELKATPEKVRIFINNSKVTTRLHKQFAPGIQKAVKKRGFKMLKAALPECEAYRQITSDVNQEDARANFRKWLSRKPANLFTEEIFNLLDKLT